MRVVKSIFGLSLALLSTPALPETWREVAKVNDVSGYIDTDDIKRDGDKVRFWMELRLPAPRTAPTGERFDRMAAMVEINCRSKTYRALRYRASMDGRTIHEGKSPGRSARPVRPGTAADNEMRAVCFNDWSSGG